MAARRPRLTEVFQEQEPAPASAKDGDATPEPAGKAPPSRAGKKAATVYLDSAAHRQLRVLALEEGSSTQQLLTEAVNDLFQARGKARIA